MGVHLSLLLLGGHWSVDSEQLLVHRLIYRQLYGVEPPARLNHNKYVLRELILLFLSS